jgi:hypothetical protein
VVVEVHEQEGQFTDEVDPPEFGVELDTVEGNDCSAPVDNVAQVQVAVALADEPRRLAPGDGPFQAFGRSRAPPLQVRQPVAQWRCVVEGIQVRPDLGKILFDRLPHGGNGTVVSVVGCDVCSRLESRQHGRRPVHM